MTRHVALSTARVAWRQSLRFRLALVYSLVALAITTLIGLVVITLLLGSMDRQFDARLNERADVLADQFTNLSKGLGQRPPAITGFTVLVDAQNRVALSSNGLNLAPGEPFPQLNEYRLPVQGTRIRAVTRKAGGFGTLWVGLPEDDLIAARESALRALLLSALITPALMMLLGWWVGRRALAGLGQAADLADRIDPTRSLATLPLPQREDEVHRLLAAINRLLVRIEAGQAREKQLLGQIVHELGAPLTVLKASLNRAAERTGDLEVGRAALVADELTFTTQDLMQLARGQLEMKMVWHYIPARTLLGRLDRLVPGTSFEGDWSGGILCDPDRLTQALRNLLANARRAAGPDGTVSLTLEDTPEQVRFVVQDSGPGLPPELGERIFEPFISGSGSSGLGLSVSRQIAVMHGGNLTGSNQGGGAQFVLSLPSATLGDDQDDDLEETEPAEVSTPAAAHR